MTGWRTPEELVEIALRRSRVVMMNEAHDGMRRCVRTREVGRRILPIAHECGVRHIAMEALPHEEGPIVGGYLAQPEMRALVDDALALGWTLVPYETHDTRSPFLPDGTVDQELVNARESDQAANLAAALPETPLLVWCGNSHLVKAADGEWTPMGMLFQELTGIDYFALDQTRTVFDGGRLAAELRGDLEPLGGTAGMLTEELPKPLRRCNVDAVIFSIHNELV